MKKFCSSEHIRPMIRLTGGELPEVFALTVHDIVPAEYGHINIQIGIGRRRRIVFVYDDKIPMQLLDAAVAEGREFLFAEAVPNFDATPDRALFAHRLYYEYAQNSQYDYEEYEDYDTGYIYDRLAITLVARAMGISIADVASLLNPES